jgi:diguanylate cyclase (GGDEF)-like protein/PAS domain S-box-containing protein
MVISRDITEQKNAENTLRRNEYELRTLVDNSPDLIFRLNRQTQYVYANPAYVQLTGILRDQLIGKTNKELGMSLQLIEFWQSAAQGVMDSGREHSVEFDMPSFFGKRYFFVRLIPEFEKTGLVETVLVIARDITERKRAEEQIRYISFHDEVTGLYNRAFFEEEIRRVDRERNLPISIIMGDVNNLKLSNDVFGHNEGDKLLKALADSIKNACRQGDIVARWGGDEFAVILPKTDFATVEEICSRINDITRESKGTALQPSIALGIATKEKRERNIYQVIRQAEERMYDFKLAHATENKNIVISTLCSYTRKQTQDYDVHLDRSYAIADKFCKVLGLSDDEMTDLHMLIDLHDIGDAVIPREILTKPGRLTPEEWSIVKKHSDAGYRVVKTFADTARISDYVLSHSEYWDGSGYPRNLKGEEIPYLSRIFLIIDSYDVMTHPRPYARAFSQEEAIEELRRNAGKQFDPELTEIFIRMLTKESAHAIR